MYIFIIGHEKCGTTALANWIESNGWAQYLTKDLKESNILTTGDSTLPPLEPGKYFLDATVGYAVNLGALRRLPQKQSKVILCVRNAFHRSWSSYKYKKIIARGGKELQKLHPVSRFNKLDDPDDMKAFLCRLETLNYPPKARPKIKEYWLKEMDNIAKTNFIERCLYELDFFLSYRFFPIVNILEQSFYTFSIRNIIRTVDLNDFTILSVEKLSDPQNRKRFITRQFQNITNIPFVERRLETQGLDIGEAKPDFSCSSFDNLRRMFAGDYRNFMGELERAQIDPSLIDQDKLVEFL